MRTFNQEKELKKIQKGNKNKVIISVIAILLIITIGSSYALYQIRYSKQIIYTQVDNFSNNKSLAVYVDDIRKEEFPSKDEYYFDKVVCDNDSTWDFDYDKWELTLTTNKEDKCNVYFTKNYRDKSGANAPELYQGLIPVYFENGNIYIADLEKKWYDYDAHEWGNAVLIDYENKKDTFYKEDGTLKGGTQIEESDILQMYVWIPRYKYQLFNAVAGETAKEQMINIKFERGTENTGDIECTYTNKGDGTIEEKCVKKGTEILVANNDWYTHPAFTLGETELEGIWVGKFAVSGNSKNITILPNLSTSSIGTMNTKFNSARDIDVKYYDKYNLNSNEIDTHMMKNIEWGVVAYLSHSAYGTCDKGVCTKVWRNPNGITGCSGDTAYERESSTCNKWNSEKGVNASTTGNMYGIYDMNGLAWDHVMSLMVDKTGEIHITEASQIQPIPNSKYYDLYSYNDEPYNFTIGHLGDATREVIRTKSSIIGSWNGEYSNCPYTLESPYFMRGGRQGDQPGLTGIFASYTTNGREADNFLIVLSAQDGNE